MNYVEEIQGEIVVIKVSHEEATLRYAMAFRNQLMELISSGKNKIIIDLTETTFMDSTFLGVLVFSLKKTLASGGGLRIVRNKYNSPIWTMFELTNMINVFKIFDGPEAALDSFNA